MLVAKENKVSYTLRKRERIKHKKLIEKIFANGKSFLVYPFKVMWIETDSKAIGYNTEYPAQFAISVSKKKFKKAVDRNLLKRRSREAYRLNKHILYNELETQNRQLAFMFIYISKEILPLEIIESKIILILRRLSKIDEEDTK